MKFFNIWNYVEVFQLDYEGLTQGGVLRVNTDFNDGSMSFQKTTEEWR